MLKLGTKVDDMIRSWDKVDDGVDAFINQHKLYHGGNKSFAKKLEGKRFNALAKNKDSGSGGNRYGLSTTTKQETASDFAYGNAGNDGVVSELYIHPEARVLNLDNPNFLDDMSEAELKKIAKDYDVIRDVNNTAGEGEYRILTDSILRDRSQLESYHLLNGNKTNLSNTEVLQPKKSFNTNVDDMLKAWTKADDAARVEGVKRLGLPDNNTAADRAKAMGYDTELFRGTTADETVAKLASGQDHHVKGISTTLYPEDAALHGDRVMPLLVKNNNPIDYMDLVDEFEYANPNKVNWTDSDLHKYATKQGYDTSILDTNMDVFDARQLIPSNVRSKFAHFNPKMAGIGGAGAILSSNLMANELDLEHKPKVSAWDSLMNTIGGVNQQQAQAYGDTGAGAFNIAGDIMADPSIVAELGMKGARGTGLGMLLQSNEVGAAERPDFFQQLQNKRVR